MCFMRKDFVQDAVLHLSEIVSQEGPRSASQRSPHLGSVGNKECMSVARTENLFYDLCPERLKRKTVTTREINYINFSQII